MARKRRRKEDDLVRRDGALALTFVNAGSRRAPRLENYADFLSWCQRHDGLSTTNVHHLEARAAESPQAAGDAFASAEQLHDLLSAIMNGRANGMAPAAAALNDLNALLTRIIPHRRLVQGPGSLQWDWPDDSGLDLIRPLWPVAISATDLLTSPSYGKVQRCARDDCDVLFLTSLAGSPRKWCDMNSCGNAIRMQAYYHRVTKPRNKMPIGTRLLIPPDE